MTSKPYTHLVDMIYSHGKNGELNITKNMPAIVNNETGNIHFVRDDNGVIAWHCNNIGVGDWNVHKITEVTL